ncbi:MAG: hypothetical protein HY695_04935 [Deltaproteobacteria bacterium]|nr:hypothetical protein [Deltaproteobacteria bacterium]
MPMAMIPGGITTDHFIKVREYLDQMIKEIEAIKGTKPGWASCRLNESRNDISPVFVGWVETSEVANQRIQKNLADPGLYRFGDDHYSQIYEECLQDPGVLKKRDWRTDLQDSVKGLWMADAKKLSVTAGVMYRRSIGIKVNGLAVGTLNVGFIEDPVGSVDAEVGTAMRKWADPSSSLVSYLQDKFQLGGI